MTQRREYITAAQGMGLEVVGWEQNKHCRLFLRKNGTTRFVIVSTSPSDKRRCLQNVKKDMRNLFKGV